MLKYYLDKTGKVIKSILFPSSEFVDTEPREGSMNPVTSGGVAGSVSQQSSNFAPNYTKKAYEANSYVMHDGVLYTNPNVIGTAEDWNPAHWTPTTISKVIDDKIDEVTLAFGAVANIIPQDATKENPLMTAEDTERMIDAMKPIDAMTLRFEFSKKDYSPVVAGVGSAGTWTKVDSPTLNVWDWTRSSNDWFNSFNAAFQDDNNKVDVIAAGDLSTITSMRQFFFNSTSVTSIPNLNTSSVTNFSYAFYKTSLKKIPAIDTSNATDLSNFIREIPTIKSIPLFDTGKVTNVQNMCYGDFNVEEGALALYEQMSTQTTPPSTTASCFKDCGKNTETGAAELAQIPASWGGTAAG